MDKRKHVSGKSFPGILKKTRGYQKELVKPQEDEKLKEVKESEEPLPQGCTPLMYACQQGNYEAVVDIIQNDPTSVTRRDRGLRTALHYCAEKGAQRLTCADRLLMANIDLTYSKDIDGLTPLHLAVIQGNVPLIQLLLANGGDVHAVDNEMHTVLHWATVCGEVGALRAVLSGGADAATADKHGGYPLHYAAQMCGAPATVDHQGRGAALEVLRTLLREGGARADVRDADGRTPLLWAASAGSAAAALALVRAGGNVDDADSDGLTALHCAASRGHTECMETLISLCGARVDSVDTNGCTPLHYAVTLGHADATAVLLQHGADANRQDRKGRSPAHCGSAKGQLQTVRMLGARGADLWLRNSRGDLPLHEAVTSGRRELIKWFLDSRPSQVNATNNDGRTPLHCAASADQPDTCRLLLEQGAAVNPIARNSSGYPMTPLDCAIAKGHRSTAKFLQAHGGVPASRLNNKNIFVDNIDVTALPGRHITSTTIDVHDRIRIEKREVYEPDKLPRLPPELSSSEEELTKKRNITKTIYQSPRVSDTDSSPKNRSRRSNYDEDKYNEKENRSRSEPSDERRRRRRTCVKRRERHYSESECSSNCDCQKKYKKRSKKSKKYSTNSSSTEEEKNMEPKKGQNKKLTKQETIVQITDSESKSKVSVKGKNLEIEYSDNKEGTERVSIEKTNNESQSAVSETESVNKTVVTEALVHQEDDSIKKSDHVIKEVEINIKTVTSPRVCEENKLQNNDKNLTDPGKGDGEESLKEYKKEEINSTDALNIETKDEVQENIAKNIDEKDDVVDSIKESLKSILKTTSNNVETLPNITTESSLAQQKDTEQQQQTKAKSIESANMKVIDNSKLSPSTSIETEKQPTSTENSTKIDDITTSGETTTLSENLSENKRKKSFEVVTTPEDMNKLINEVNKEKLNISPLEQNKILQQEETEGFSESQLENDKRKLFESTTASSFETKTEDISKDEGTDVKLVNIPVSNEKGDHLVVIERSPKTSRKASKEESRKESLYETESYKVLSGVDGMSKETDEFSDDDKESIMESSRFIKENSYGRIASVSDNEMYSRVDVNSKRKKLKKRNKTKTRSSTLRSKSENSERGYESSGVMDSGFGPSPRILQRNRIMSPRLRAYYEKRNTSGRSSKIPVRKPGDRYAVDMASVTQRIQTNMRRYYAERKIFHFLHELKRLQIRSSKTTEAILVKRAIDEYNKTSLVHVGMGAYSSPEYTFSNFEKFLYESLRKLQKSGKRHLENLPEQPSFDYGETELYKMGEIPDNPCLCTNKTHRCYHAVHAYTGVPCSAYITKANHHTMPKPSPGPSFLPKIGRKPQITLEVNHGTDKKLIALPAEKLEKNKKYYVTFTVKSSNGNSDNDSGARKKTNLTS